MKTVCAVAVILLYRSRPFTFDSELCINEHNKKEGALTLNKIEQLLQEIEPKVIAWRRHFHQNPELSFKEEKTSQTVYDALCAIGNLEVTRPTATSVMARLIGNKPGEVLAIRADMDALPVQEETGFDFASQNPGVMHACGHDSHTAMLLGTATVLSQFKDKINGEVRFLFQHAEESFPGGS